MTSDQASAPEASGGCRPAPDWLVDAISQGILVRGAYLSTVFIGPASGFTAGPEVVFLPGFKGAWWVAGRLNGAGLQPELAVWVTNRTAETNEGDLFAVNPSARRYSSWGSGGSEQIDGDGLGAVQDCVGPMPRT